MTMLIADAAWPEVGQASRVLVPLGSIEQHGPHLPLNTDAVIAEAVAHEIARRSPGTWVAPTLTYGASGEHQAFPGTSSIGNGALHTVLIELVRSLRTWTSCVVFVNAHGGNLHALDGAVRLARREGHDVGWVPCAPEDGDLHAGHAETSLMLHLRPDSVRLDRLEPGTLAPLNEIMPRLVAEGVRAVSPNGVLGDPRRATAAEGLRILEAMIDDAMRRLTERTTA